MQASSRGSFLAISAFTIWGLFPFYFKELSHIGSLDVLANRIIWSVVTLSILLFLIGKYWISILSVFRDKKQLACLFLGAVLIAVNWGLYIWAVDNNHLFEASLGYYINPLFNVLVGIFLLKERFNRWQCLALIFAAIGVSLQVIALSKIPWVSLCLATSFSLYGFIHKKIAVAAIPGLFIEACVLLPFALIYLLYLILSDGNGFHGPLVWTVRDWLWLMAAGPVTVLPLLLFTMAAKRMAYSILGFIQYITPSLLFLLALFYYDEPFSVITLITFIFIWLALMILSIDMLRANKQTE